MESTAKENNREGKGRSKGSKREKREGSVNVMVDC